MGWKTYGANFASKTRQKEKPQKKKKLKKIKIRIFCPALKQRNRKTKLHSVFEKTEKPFPFRKNQKIKKSKTNRTTPKHHNAVLPLIVSIVLSLIEGLSLDHGGHVPKLNILRSGQNWSPSRRNTMQRDKRSLGLEPMCGEINDLAPTQRCRLFNRLLPP